MKARTMCSRRGYREEHLNVLYEEEHVNLGLIYHIIQPVWITIRSS